MISILPKFFQKIEKEGESISNLFVEAYITPVPKLDKYISRKENNIPIFILYKETKLLNNIFAN